MLRRQAVASPNAYGQDSYEHSSEEPSGLILNRYRVLESRAEGGFGTVEVCWDTRLQRRVAIKCIPLSAPGAATSASTIQEALSEARTSCMLSHPNIVTVFDFEADWRAYASLPAAQTVDRADVWSPKGDSLLSWRRGHVDWLFTTTNAAKGFLRVSASHFWHTVAPTAPLSARSTASWSADQLSMPESARAATAKSSAAHGIEFA